MSRRRSAAAVGAGADGARLLADTAAAAAARRPSSVIARVRPLLGLNASAVQAAADAWLAPLSVVPFGARASAAVTLPPSPRPRSAEELAASILHHARTIAEATAGGPITDAVVTVPPSMPATARGALLDAAAAAGLSVLALVPTPTAAALAYGIERSWGKEKAFVLFFEQGSTHTSAALAAFAAGGGPAGAGAFEIVDLAWDDATGSDALDGLLLAHFQKEFEAATKTSIAADHRALARLRAAVRRTKEILSANADAPVSVEELAGGVDFRSTISRAEFEAMAAKAGFWARSVAPVVALLRDNAAVVKPSSLAAVELVGGGTRVPGLQAALTAALGGRALDRHMDADEAVLHGAALFGANASTAFRLKRFGGADVAPFAVALSHAPLDAAGGSLAPATRSKQALLPFGRALPARRVAKLSPKDAGAKADGWALTVSYDPASKRGPPGDGATLVGEWRVSGLLGALAERGGAQRVEVAFATTPDGRLAPERADAVAEYEEEYEVQVPIVEEEKGGKGKKADAKAADAAAKNGTAADPPKFKTEKRTRTRTARHALKLTGALAWPRLAPADAAAVAAALAADAAADATAAANAAAKNELEAYVIDARGRLDDEGDEALKAAATADDRGALHAALTDAEDWLYGEGEGETAAAFSARLATLRGAAEPVFLRARERADLPPALTAATAAAASATADAKAWKKARPWLPAKEVAGLGKKAAALATLATKDGAAQIRAPPTAPPKLLSADVLTAVAELEAERERLAAVAAPAPPVAAPAAPPAAAPAPAPAAPPAAAPTPSPAAGDEEGSHDEL
jgi:hypoxia up-regulated 1